MKERGQLITLHGNPLTLMGNEVKVGAAAPDAELLNTDLKPVKLSNYLGKVVILTTVPSLDTPVCDMETRKFNKEASGLGKDIVILTVSMDLPFAQKRWCGAAGADKVITLSDHRAADLGGAFGVLIKELRLLARAVYVIDKKGVVQYVQMVKETADEPDYAPILKAAKNLV